MFAHVDGPRFREFFTRHTYGVHLTADDLATLLTGNFVHSHKLPRKRDAWTGNPFSGFCLAWDTFFSINLNAIERTVHVHAVMHDNWERVLLLRHAQVTETCTIDDLTRYALLKCAPEVRGQVAHFTGIPWEVVLIEDSAARQAARAAYIQTAALL